MNKIKSNDPKIVSITYSMKFGSGIYMKVWEADKKGRTLTEKIEDIPSVRLVKYPVKWESSITISFKTDSIKKVDPKFNNQLWQKIAKIIEEHIEE